MHPRTLAAGSLLGLLVMIQACGSADGSNSNTVTTQPEPPIPKQPGSVRVTITDRFGANLSGATVTLLQGSSSIGSATSPSTGSLLFTEIPPGTYSVRVTKSGFVTTTAATSVVSLTTATVSARLEPDALPSGGASGTRVISGSGTSSLVFETDIFVVDQSSQFITGLGASAFSVSSFATSSGTTLSFTLATSQTISQTSRGPYSAAMLLDQSGSIASTDPNDSRIQAAKIFLSAVGSGDNVVVAAFAGSGRTIPFETTIYGNFTTNGPSYYGTLDKLAGLVAGGTPLYKSTYALVDYTAQNAPTANRAVVVFTDGEDTEGGITPAQLYARAKAANVNIFTVALGNSVDVAVLQDMANQTGGAMMLATDARQLVSMYGTLGNLLHGASTLYRLRWTGSRTSGTWTNGTFYTSVRVGANQGAVFVPFAVKY